MTRISMILLVPSNLEPTLMLSSAAAGHGSLTGLFSARWVWFVGTISDATILKVETK